MKKKIKKSNFSKSVIDILLRIKQLSQALRANTITTEEMEALKAAMQAAITTWQKSLKPIPIMMECDDCGYQQEDMGSGVVCEDCGGQLHEIGE